MFEVGNRDRALVAQSLAVKECSRYGLNGHLAFFYLFGSQSAAGSRHPARMVSRIAFDERQRQPTLGVHSSWWFFFFWDGGDDTTAGAIRNLGMVKGAQASQNVEFDLLQSLFIIVSTRIACKAQPQQRNPKKPGQVDQTFPLTTTYVLTYLHPSSIPLPPPSPRPALHHPPDIAGDPPPIKVPRLRPDDLPIDLADPRHPTRIEAQAAPDVPKPLRRLLVAPDLAAADLVAALVVAQRPVRRRALPLTVRGPARDLGEGEGRRERGSRDVVGGRVVGFEHPVGGARGEDFAAVPAYAEVPWGALEEGRPGERLHVQLGLGVRGWI